MKTTSTLAVALFAILVLPASSLRAEEGGSGHYLPGSMSSFMDAPPPKGAFIVRYNMVYYTGDLSVNEPLPIAGLQTLGAEADSWAHGVTLGWGTPIDLGERLTWSVTATVPYVWMDVSANVTAGGITGQRTSSVNGLGDIVLMPVMLNYGISSNWSANFRVAGYAPTGEYEVGRLANTGKNFWSIEPTLGVMYFGQKNGIEASVYFGADYNFENPDTDYKTGTQLHVDGTLAQHFPLFGGLSGVGVNAYWYEQVTGDSGSGASFGDFKGRTAGLGPVLPMCSKSGAWTCWPR
jgi:hypothetical protein